MKIIAVASQKGGCGKTTTVVNLAAEFARLGLSVLVVDLDPQANASLHLGEQHPSEVPVTCAELLLCKPDAHQETLMAAVQTETKINNVALIYGTLALGRAEDDLQRSTPRPSEELRYKLEPLDGVFDVILLDCPPSLRLLTSNALAAATHLIIPVESGSQYGMFGVVDLMSHVSRIRRINPGLEVMGTLLMRHDDRQTVCKMIEKSAARHIGKLLPVRISASTKVNQAAATRASLTEMDRSCKVAREFRQLAAVLAQNLEFAGESMELSHD